MLTATRIFNLAVLLALLTLVRAAEPDDFWNARFTPTAGVCELVALVDGPRVDDQALADFWLGFYYFAEDLSAEHFEYEAESTYLVLRFLNDALMGQVIVVPQSVTVNGRSPTHSVNLDGADDLELAIFSAEETASILLALVRSEDVVVDLETPDGNLVKATVRSGASDTFHVNNAMFSACIGANAA